MEPDDLYGLALDRFIPERGALAKALRADKRRDEAAEVAALRKPSVAAWAVNQLVRTQGDGLRELFDAGDGLREAQADLLAGRGDGRTLRAANERERDAVDTLVEAARGLLSSDGHELSPAVVERVADTLHAAALDAGAREQVRDGRLERELRHAGLGLGESPGPAPRPRRAADVEAKATARGARRARRARGPRRSSAGCGPLPRGGRRGAPRRPRAGQAGEGRARAGRARAHRGAQGGAHRRGRGPPPRRTRRARAEGRRGAPRPRGPALEQADEALAAAQAEAQEAVDAQRAAQAEYEQLS